MLPTKLRTKDDAGGALRGCRNLSAALVVLALLLGAASAQAQVSTAGVIVGRVTDKDTRAPLDGVSVVALGSQGEESILTDADGMYTLAALPVGTYTVYFFWGDSKVEQQNVTVSIDKTVRIDAAMPGKGLSETYVITEKAPAIDVGSSRVSVTLDKDFARHVPTSRDVGGTLSRAPGAFDDAVGVSLSGATGLENSYTVDGVNVTNVSYGSLGKLNGGTLMTRPVFNAVHPSLINDFIEETEIISGGYNAEYGRAMGGVVNVVTKSGSNEFHGSAFGTWSPSWMTGSSRIAYSRATSYDGVMRPNFAANLGFEVGGPLIKNRAFFWAGYSPTFVSNHMVRIVTRFKDADNDGAPDSKSPGGPVDAEEIGRSTVGGSATGHQVGAKVTLLPAPDHTLSLTYFGNFTSTDEPRAASADPRTAMEQAVANNTDLSAHWVSQLLAKKWQIDAGMSFHQEHTSSQSPYADLNGSNFIAYLNQPSVSTFEPSYASACTRRAADPMNGVPAFNPCPAQGYIAGGFGGLDYATARRVALQLKSTHRFRAGGHHELKYGVDAEINSLDDRIGFSGPDGGRAAVTVFRGGAATQHLLSFPAGTHGYQFQDYDPKTRNEDPNGDGKISDLFGPTYLQDFYHPTTTTQNLGGFLQDGYSLLPNLTFNAGVRWERQDLKDYGGNSVMTISDNIAPRVGVVYDPTNAGRSKIYGHWGRFYESIPMDLNNVAFSGQGALSVVWVDPACTQPFDQWAGNPNQSWKTCDINKLPTRMPGAFIQQFGGENAMVQPHIKGQYSDEIILGGQYELFHDLVVGAAYINRRLGRIVENSSGDGGSTFVISNPGDVPDGVVRQASDDAKAAADRAASAPTPANQAAAREAASKAGNLAAIATFDKPQRTYNALQLTANKRFSRNWLILASYTYSRVIGNYAGLYSADTFDPTPNASAQYDTREQLINRKGPLPTDHPHIFRVDGYYTIPIGAGGIITGLGVLGRSGQPVSYLGRNDFGPSESFILPRGAGGRAPFFTQVDAHLGYGRKFRGGTHLDAFIDVFNVFDEEEAVSVSSLYTTSYVKPIVGGSQEDLKYLKAYQGSFVKNPDFRNATAYNQPISGRLGLRLTF